MKFTVRSQIRAYGTATKEHENENHVRFFAAFSFKAARTINE